MGTYRYAPKQKQTRREPKFIQKGLDFGEPEQIAPVISSLASEKTATPAAPLLLLRIGDFYEIRGDDAELGAMVLGLTLTTRDGSPMVSFPAQLLDENSAKLLDAGYQTAVLERPTEQQLQALQAAQATLEPVKAQSAPVQSTPPTSKTPPLYVSPASPAQASEPAAPTVPIIPAQNYRITDNRLGEYTPKERYENNRDAIKTLKLLESENRHATPEEQNTLAKFTGWGALAENVFGENRQGKWERDAHQEMQELLTPEEYDAARASTLNAHYTSPVVIKAMWDKIEKMGFAAGNVLEPAMGAGRFFGLAPEKIVANSQFFGVELDSLTGRIAQKLYPQAQIQITGYEKTAPNGGFYDVAIGNVPFGGYKVFDPEYNKNKFPIHDYFFAKTLDQVRPNGIVAFISSSGTMDKQDRAARQYLAERAKLLGAVRLPNNAFTANAGTEVTTDIIFLQKRETLAIISQNLLENPAYDKSKGAKNEDENGNKILPELAEVGVMKTGVRMVENPAYDQSEGAKNEDENGKEIPEFIGEPIIERDWVNLSSTTNEQGEEIPLNPYFVEHPEMILGTMSLHGKMYGGEQTTCEPLPGANLAEQLTGAMARVENGDLSHIVEIKKDNSGNVIPDPNEYIPATPDVQPFAHVVRNGEIYFREDSRMRKVKFAKTATGALTKQGKIDRDKTLRLIELGDALKALYDVQKINANTEESLDVKTAQEKLNTLYDAFVARHGRLNTGVFDTDDLIPQNLLKDDGAKYKSNSILSNADVEVEVLRRANAYSDKLAFYEEKLAPYIEQVQANEEEHREDDDYEAKTEEDIIREATKTYHNARKMRREELRQEGKDDDEIKRIAAVEFPSPPKSPTAVQNPTERLFGADARWWSICSLEIIDENNHNFFKRKADVFSKRTILGQKNVAGVETPADALAVSVSERGSVDLDFMSGLLEAKNLDREAIADELQTQGLIYLNPENLNADKQPQYETESEYLSGNVRDKLRVARERVARERKDNPNATRYERNVSALERVQPVELTAEQISMQLGATWIPAKRIQEFVYELFQTPDYQQSKIVVEYADEAIKGAWQITDKKNKDAINTLVTKTYGTDRINGYELLELCLNLKRALIKDADPTDPTGKKKITNKDETYFANEKQKDLKQAFTDWIYRASNVEVREELTRIYNERFNSIRQRQYDGQNLAFRGMASNITLRPHQLDAIARVIYGGNALLAHEVGAGKTFTMVAGAMESKRIGLCKKSVIAVPKHLVGQTAGEFLRLYPDANILVATENDFNKNNRKKFCARIAAGNYDAVIMGHTQLERLKLSVARQQEHLQKELAVYRAALTQAKKEKQERYSVKQLEKTVKIYEGKLQSLMAAGVNDNVIDFELLGADKLFVDEAHNFKNLGVQTKIRNLSMTSSRRANDLYLKCHWLDETTNSKGVVFATGTPISNSMAELYVMMKYLYNDKLNQAGLNHFDSWATTFGETTTDYELTVSGQYKQRERFAKFNNLPELMKMCKEFMDIKMAAELNLDVPKDHQHIVEIGRSETQAAIMESIIERAAAVNGGNVDPKEDNMLKISTDARRMALDQRLIDPLLPDEGENGKVGHCVKNVVDVYNKKTFDRDGKEIEKPTQLVFCDLSTPKADDTFNVYDDIKKKLIANGIPAKEIAYIHDAKNDAQKVALFKKVNGGAIRILIGSTEKMGAGTNVQTRLAAVHHIDCPWRPSDLTQRNGRIIRPGNQHPKIDIYNYVTKKTFDAYQYQILAAKQKFISQIFNSNSNLAEQSRTVEDVDSTVLNFEEMKAVASDNPLILTKMQLSKRVKELRLLRNNHIKNQSASHSDLTKTLPERTKRLTERLANYQKDLEQIPPLVDNFAPVEIAGEKFDFKDDLKRAGERIIQICQSGQALHNDIPLGAYRKMPMTLCFRPESLGGDDKHAYKIRLNGKSAYSISVGESATGNFTKMNNEIDKIPTLIKAVERDIENNQKQIEILQAERNKPFPHEAELKETAARLAEVERELLDSDKSKTNPEQDEQAPANVAEPTPLNPRNLSNGEEQHQIVISAADRKEYWYDYRDMNGVLFSCVKSTLDECRAARDEWTVTKYIRGEVENQDPNVRAFDERAKETINAALAETAKKMGLQTKERAERPQNPRVQIIERGNGASR